MSYYAASLCVCVSVQLFWSERGDERRIFAGMTQVKGHSGWMDPYKISPSINNHDWFQGHKLLQARVWKSGMAHAQWPGMHQSLQTNTFFFSFTKDKDRIITPISKDCIAVLKLSIVFTHKIVRVVLKCMTDWCKQSNYSNLLFLQVRFLVVRDCSVVLDQLTLTQHAYK